MEVVLCRGMVQVCSAQEGGEGVKILSPVEMAGEIVSDASIRGHVAEWWCALSVHVRQVGFIALYMLRWSRSVGEVLEVGCR